ncbi:hypothetical protein CTRI78_v003317 [Colletotrichum trifolii]|uniref:Uncharacterized protein n=1 Tax=Colletotrichum trifolii TaxID=5466 RepID=A0A4R8RJS7_COLTR|nr:hypothetical protein CTRI78_v003317 [Colletotrichum trifolii]
MHLDSNCDVGTVCNSSNSQESTNVCARKRAGARPAGSSFQHTLRCTDTRVLFAVATCIISSLKSVRCLGCYRSSSKTPLASDASGALEEKSESRADDPWSSVGLCRNTTNFRRSEVMSAGAKDTAATLIRPPNSDTSRNLRRVDSMTQRLRERTATRQSLVSNASTSAGPSGLPGRRKHVQAKLGTNDIRRHLSRLPQLSPKSPAALLDSPLPEKGPVPIPWGSFLRPFRGPKDRGDIGRGHL